MRVHSPSTTPVSLKLHFGRFNPFSNPGGTMRSESIAEMMKLAKRLNEIVAEMEVRKAAYLETLRS